MGCSQSTNQCTNRRYCFCYAWPCIKRILKLCISVYDMTEEIHSEYHLHLTTNTIIKSMKRLTSNQSFMITKGDERLKRTIISVLTQCHQQTKLYLVVEFMVTKKSNRLTIIRPPPHIQRCHE